MLQAAQRSRRKGAYSGPLPRHCVLRSPESRLPSKLTVPMMIEPGLAAKALAHVYTLDMRASASDQYGSYRRTPELCRRNTDHCSFSAFNSDGGKRFASQTAVKRGVA